MPTKQQHQDKRPEGKKANLGQQEAELEKLGKERMSHMESGKPSKPGKQHTTKRGSH